MSTGVQWVSNGHRGKAVPPKLSDLHPRVGSLGRRRICSGLSQACGVPSFLHNVCTCKECVFRNLYRLFFCKKRIRSDKYK